MKTRVITSIVGAPILLLCSYYGGWLMALLAVLLSGAGAWELSRLWAGKGWQVIKPLDIGSAVLIALSLAFIEQVNGLFFVVLLLVAALYALVDRQRGGADYHGLSQALATFYVGIGLGSLAALRLSQPSWLLILLAFLNVWTTDSAAYLVGRRFGRHHLAPRISPNKTWEGALAGSLCGMLVCSTYMALALHINYSVALGLAFIFTVLAQLGDLLESALKRWGGIKDTSNILPGHGGILDRFDSLMLTAPFILLLVGIVL